MVELGTGKKGKDLVVGFGTDRKGEGFVVRVSWEMMEPGKRGRTCVADAGIEDAGGCVTRSVHPLGHMSQEDAGKAAFPVGGVSHDAGDAVALDLLK